MCVILKQCQGEQTFVGEKFPTELHFNQKYSMQIKISRTMFPQKIFFGKLLFPSEKILKRLKIAFQKFMVGKELSSYYIYPF